MKTSNRLLVITLVAVCGLALSARATILVQDQWADNDRTDPASPQYAENDGVNPIVGDADGELESAWFVGGSGTLGTQTGTLLMSNATTSATYTTYFTPEATPVTLASAGDTLKITWAFTPRGVNTSNTSQGLPFAVVNSPSASRLTVDGAPGSDAYAGYSMAMNMGNTLKNSNPFILREWNVASGALLSASGSWANLAGANGATSGNHGYDSDTAYTFVMTFSLLTGGDLEIGATMTGGTLNGVGFASVVYTDSTPDTLTFDTVALRPSLIASTATAFDTSLFQVEFTAIPEPSTLALVGAGLGLMFAMIRRRRS